MIRNFQKTPLLPLAAFTLLSAGALIAYAQEKEHETSAALSADQVIGAIRVAVEAKPGKILEVEGETEKGMASCEVKVLGADGKIYEVVVSATTGKVTSVGLDDDQNEKKDGADKED